MRDAVSPAANPRRGRVPLLLVAVLIAAAFILVVLRSDFQTGDSLEYARAIRSGINLFHPHHLLFNPIIRGVWKGLQAVFPSADPLDAAQAHNIFWALVVLAGVFVMIRRMTESSAAAALFSLGLFASLGFWQYATLAEVYIPAMGCLVLILVLLQPSRPAPLRRVLQLAVLVLFCLAVLYNQISVLFAGPLFYLLAKRLGRRGGIKALGFLVACADVVLAVYIAAFSSALQPKTVDGFVRWCLSYAFSPDPRWGSLSNISLLGGAKILLSFARNFAFVPESLFLPAAAGTGLLLAALVALTVRAILRRAPEPEFRLALLIWLGLTVAFIWWFTPYGYELYIPLLPLFFLLAARLLADRRGSAARRPANPPILFILAAAFALLAAWNMVRVILPDNAGRGPDYQRALRVQEAAPARATLIADFELREVLLYYFERPRVLEDGPLLYSFYRHWTLRPDQVPEPDRPTLVSVSFLSPDSVSAKPYSAETHPAEWRAFVEWLLDCEITGGRLVAARTASSVPGLPGYLLLSAERSSVDGWAGLFRALDAASAEAPAGYGGPFTGWMSRHSGFVR